MEEQIILITTKEQLKQILKELITEKEFIRSEFDIKNDRINRTEAAKLAEVSLPTFSKMVKAGLFPQHGWGRNKFFLKNEIITALKKEAKE